MPRSPARFTQADVTRDTPIRLVDIIGLAFPAGGMTVAGLRKERDRGRLAVERIAGKEFTTLAAIDRMRDLCRTELKARDCTSRDEGRPRDGSSAMAPPVSPQAAALAIARRLKEGSPPTSPTRPPATSPPEADVIRLKSRSPT